MGDVGREKGVVSVQLFSDNDTTWLDDDENAAGEGDANVGPSLEGSGGGVNAGREKESPRRRSIRCHDVVSR